MRHIANPYALIAATVMLCACSDSDDPTPDPVGPEPMAGTALCSRVFEYTPAPGQFINEDESLATPAQAADWAMQRLNEQIYVSLGGFGGYIVVGFDHAVTNSGDYDIGVIGNAFTGQYGNSSEPGIVYVMQDTNRNGLPDDTWYQLRGSETGKASSSDNYAVTYYRPDGPAQPVRWTDNRGGSGQIRYMSLYHKQPYYYPAWIKDDSYTLAGTLLTVPDGAAVNDPFAWGYADNLGSDNLATGMLTLIPANPGPDFEPQAQTFPNLNRFRIADAIDANGKPVDLKTVNFVKIQTGRNADGGIFGEISTEVRAVVDLHQLSL